MSTIEIKLYRFNHQDDYLPYYLTYHIEYDPLNTVYDLLEDIEKYDNFGFDIEAECFLRINNFFTNSSVLIDDVIDRCGYEWTIDPISEYRSKVDLIINDQDYFDKLTLFKKYMSKKEFNSYLYKYYLEYYASNSIRKNSDYIGDHNLLIAYDLIHSTFDINIQNEIIQIVKNETNGIWYHTSLKDRLLFDTNNATQKIDELFKMCKIKKKETPKNDIIFSDTIQNFSDFNIGFYNNSEFSLDTKKLKAKVIECFSFKNQLPFYIVDIDEKFLYKIAGEVLLDAKDNGCDFLIVNNKEELEIFDKKQKKIEKTVGREINLPILTRQQFAMLVNGERNRAMLGTHKHNIHVPFVDYYLFS